MITDDAVNELARFYGISHDAIESFAKLFREILSKLSPEELEVLRNAMIDEASNDIALEIIAT